MVLGSVNVDIVVRTSRLPAPGETVLGDSLARHFGGKGANQAVAAARAGADVSFIGAVGADADGDASLTALAAESIDVSHVSRSEAPTGTAIIAVRPDGENQIVVAPGANAEVQADTVRAALADLIGPGEPAVLVACLEVPMRAVVAALAAADDLALPVVLNPAPATRLPTEILDRRPILVPNEHELLETVGAADMDRALGTLASAGIDAVVTLGDAGCLVLDGGEQIRIPAFSVGAVVDTTGAGDTFVGVLATWLARGASLREAAQAANVAAGLSIGSAGARGGMPRRPMIEGNLQAHDHPMGG